MVGGVVSLMGCTIAPFVAVSHAAKRTHFFPVASKGISKRFVPNAGRSARRNDLPLGLHSVTPHDFDEIQRERPFHIGDDGASRTVPRTA